MRMKNFRSNCSSTILARLTGGTGVRKIGRVVMRTGFKSNVFARLFGPVLADVCPYTIRRIGGAMRGRTHVVSALRPIVVERGVVVTRAIVHSSCDICRRGKRGCSLVCRVAHLDESENSLTRSSHLSTLAVTISC